MHRACALVVAVLAFAIAADADDKPVTADQELSAAIDILKAHHINRDKVDWAKLETAAHAEIQSANVAADAYPAIREIIEQLGAKHTSLLPADYARAISTGQKVGDAKPPRFDPPETMVLEGGIAMLRVPWFQGTEAHDRAYVAALRKPLNHLAQRRICRFIVDLRGNYGGNMYPMLNGLMPLLGKPPFGFWYAANTPRGPWTVLNMPTEEAGLKPYVEPIAALGDVNVAVLLDEKTVSSGEFTAMAFEGRPRTRFFGGPTGGYVTANASYKLPDGAQLAVTVSWATDRTGREYHENIAPDEATDPGQPTIDAAISWLKTQRCK